MTSPACRAELEIRVDDLVSAYDFHDMPATIALYCPRRRGHIGSHRCVHNGYEISWRRVPVKKSEPRPVILVFR